MLEPLPLEISHLIDRALREDVGDADWTTRWTIPVDCRAEAEIVAKGAGVIAGVEVARAVFLRVDPHLEVTSFVRDGVAVRPGDRILTLQGAADSIITAERVALNFLQHLSGVATLTRAYVDAVAGTGARILDTRKTLPGLRWLQKAAVRAGGGENHRFGLHDMVLIKENHIAAAGGIPAALEAVRERNAGRLEVEIEVTNAAELLQALEVGVDRILLDNMSLDQLRACVARVRDSGPTPPKTEASGGVNLDSVRAIAETGVDYISVGALTHSVPALDLSLLVLRA